jgi:hypothetical protein
MEAGQTGGADGTTKPALRIEGGTCLGLDGRKVNDLGVADEPREDER